MGESKNLDENSKAIYYSDWFFVAIRLAAMIPGLNSPDTIAKHLELPLAKVNRAVEFMVEHGLLELKDGTLKTTAQHTHLSAQSPLVGRHHKNWRLKAIESCDSVRNDELFFTSPVTIATKDIPQVRSILTQAIEDIFKVIEPSKDEELACLNIDWFKLK